MKEYIITLDESEMTPELRTLLESKGAHVREAPIPELHLPPEVEAEILRDLEAADRGDFSNFRPWEEVRAELDQLIERHRADD